MNIDESTIEELTAYLDGELEASDVQRVELRLSSDPAYLAEMQALQKTWDLFDRLPTGQPDPGFVRTTMELVVKEVTNDVQKLSRKNLAKWWRWPLRIGLFLSLPLALLAVSFAVTWTVRTKPHRQLVNDLLVIENLDRYQKIDQSVFFLSLLDEHGLFAEDPTYDATLAGELPVDLVVYNQPGVFAPRETIAQRQRRIESLDIEQRNDLRRSYEDYLKLSESAQQALREFHNELSSHPNHERLSRVLNAYYDWLKTLGVREQASLLDMPCDLRLQEIEKIKTRQARAAFGKDGATKLPTTRDAEFLFDWYEIVIARNEELIRSRFPYAVADYQQRTPDVRQVSAQSLKRFSRMAPLNQLVGTLIRIDRDLVQDLVSDDIDLLRAGLSFEAREIIDVQTTEEKQKQLVLKWIESANQSRSSISSDRLQEFYEQLPQSERDELDQMAPADWISTLILKYRQHQNPQRPAATPFDALDDWELFESSFGIQ
jgi:hypothetical protein